MLKSLQLHTVAIAIPVILAMDAPAFAASTDVVKNKEIAVKLGQIVCEKTRPDMAAQVVAWRADFRGGEWIVQGRIPNSNVRLFTTISRQTGEAEACAAIDLGNRGRTDMSIYAD